MFTSETGYGSICAQSQLLESGGKSIKSSKASSGWQWQCTPLIPELGSRAGLWTVRATQRPPVSKNQNQSTNQSIITNSSSAMEVSSRPAWDRDPVSNQQRQSKAGLRFVLAPWYRPRIPSKLASPV